MLNPLAQLYKGSLTLLTDFYQLTMAYGYWKTGIHETESVFYQSFRKAPFEGAYAVNAGLGTLIDYLTDFHFSVDDIDFLRTQVTPSGKVLFDENFLDYLKHLRFTCDVDAVEEGTCVFPNEPLLRVRGPLLQCQFIETILLNSINFQTLVATYASHLRQTVGEDPLLEFGLRRAQGIDGALTASRAAYIGGASGTSNMLAAKLYDIPARGTQAHSWIMAFPTELEAFTQFAKIFPENCVLVVDTFNSYEGVKNAIRTAQYLKKQGYDLKGIRLDSGDLAVLSKKARQLLDAAGFEKVKIIASNNLTPEIITSLKQQSAEVSEWAVGTKLVTAFSQPALEGVYKMSALKNSQGKWEYKIKLSEQSEKISIPGINQIKRIYNKEKQAVADIIVNEMDPVTERYRFVISEKPILLRVVENSFLIEDLLIPIFRAGKLVYKKPSLKEIKQKLQHNLALFDNAILRKLNPTPYPVFLEERLYHLKMKLIGEKKEAIHLLDDF